MKYFMSNPCGYGHCMEWQCEKCSHFKPRFFNIPVPRRLGWLLAQLLKRLTQNIVASVMYAVEGVKVLKLLKKLFSELKDAAGRM